MIKPIGSLAVIALILAACNGLTAAPELAEVAAEEVSEQLVTCERLELTAMWAERRGNMARFGRVTTASRQFDVAALEGLRERMSAQGLEGSWGQRQADPERLTRMESMRAELMERFSGQGLQGLPERGSRPDVQAHRGMKMERFSNVSPGQLQTLREHFNKRHQQNHFQQRMKQRGGLEFQGERLQGWQGFRASGC